MKNMGKQSLSLALANGLPYRGWVADTCRIASARPTRLAAAAPAARAR